MFFFSKSQRSKIRTKIKRKFRKKKLKKRQKNKSTWKLLDSEHVWCLLDHSIVLLSTASAPLCTTLFELFIVCISRQYERPDERIDIWSLFHQPARLAIIDKLVRGAVRAAENSETGFHLLCRAAQFIESLGKFFVYELYLFWKI